jgi:4-diphosphocytidyl-2-C-methyl-D-erythritol kinase
MAAADLGGPGFAPAKVNLALHVTGQRGDGYHLLDSLVVFAGVGDDVGVAQGDALTLEVDGPRAAGVPVDGRNLVLRAAGLLAGPQGARMTLTKRLPHAAGIGGGSSDAAAALRVLGPFWGVAVPGPDDPAVLALGADVPVCLAAPAPQRMRGIGEQVTAVPALPEAALVLVNPGVEVPTPAVFRGLEERCNPPMPEVPGGMDFARFVAWLRTTRNDLQAPAERIAPEVSAALVALRGQPDIGFAVMSGSGATCVGLARDMAGAERAAAAIARAMPGWWVVPAPMLG